VVFALDYGIASQTDLKYCIQLILNCFEENLRD